MSGKLQQQQLTLYHTISMVQAGKEISDKLCPTIGCIHKEIYILCFEILGL